MRFEAPSQDTGLVALVSSECFGALLRKEKDGASRPDCFRADSWMPSFSVLRDWRFFYLHIPLWSLNSNPFAQCFCADKLKDQ